MAFGRHPRSGGRRALWLVVIAVVGLVAIVWAVRQYRQNAVTPSSAGRESGAASANAERIAAGHAVYDAHCASCHGAGLEGQPGWQRPLPNGRMPAPPQDANGQSWRHPNKMLFDLVKYGPAKLAPPGYESDMPAFAGTLSDDRIWMVLEFIESTWPEDIRRQHAAMGGERAGGM